MITDAIMSAALLFFFYTGWRKGAFRALLGPISLAVGCLAAFLYYRQTQNLAISLTICALSPFALRILTSITLKIWSTATKKEIPLSFLSRLFGSIFSVLWSGSYLVLMLILIGLIPIQIPWLEKIQNDVTVSRSYNMLHQFIDDKVPAASVDIKKLTEIFENPEQLQQFQSTEEFETLLEDDNLKNLLSDEETAEQIRNKDYTKLMANPKIQSLFQNEELLKKMFALNKKIIESSLAEGNLSNTETEAQPKVIDTK